MKTLIPPEITRDNWLIKAGDLAVGQYLKLYPLGNLTYDSALAAVEAAYGKNSFWVGIHGNSLSIGRR